MHPVNLLLAESQSNILSLVFPQTRVLKAGLLQTSVFAGRRLSEALLV